MKRVNLEHIFSGDAESFAWDIFEPRQAPMPLRQISTRRVRLYERWSGEKLSDPSADPARPAGLTARERP